MPGQCEAVGCTSHSLMSVNKPSFHRFPKDPERKKQWAVALKKLRRDGTTWMPSDSARLCGKHFINGKPSQDPTHPDFIPTIFNHKTVKTPDTVEKKMKRYHSAKRRRQLFQTPSRKGQAKSTPSPSEPPSTPLTQSNVTGTLDDSFSDVNAPSTSADSTPLISPQKNMRTPLSSTERSMMYDEMDALRRERDDALKRTQELESKLKKASLTAGSVENNDTKCKQTTGLSWVVFITTFNFLSTFAPKKKHRGVAPLVDQFFITLVKLRTGVTFDFLSSQTDIAKTTLIEIFWKWIDIMHINLSFLIRSPDPEAVRRTLPPIFRRCYNRLTCIVDCFEIFIDQPKNLKARAQTYSNYKKHNTVKVFIGCTPLGAISFVSSAWGGRVSDIELIRKSGFINPDLHSTGDQILADRGFLVQEDFSIELGVHFIIPAFTKGKKQLSAKEVELSRKLAAVRIHIERVIGVLKNRYTILQGPLPITLIKSVKDESMERTVARIDKIIHVCASLVNLEGGIVYNED